jgi:hypothetical protein
MLHQFEETAKEQRYEKPDVEPRSCDDLPLVSTPPRIDPHYIFFALFFHHHYQYATATLQLRYRYVTSTPLLASLYCRRLGWQSQPRPPIYIDRSLLILLKTYSTFFLSVR